MKRGHAVLLVFLSLLVACHSAEETDAQPRLVTVNGHAEIRVVPDEVIVSLGVETRNVDLSRAKSENDARVEAVIEAVEALEIPRKHIKTEYVRIEPVYETMRKLRLEFYRVRKTMVITLREIDKFESLLSAALEAGANHVHGVDFRTTELRKHRDDARALAIQAAREKAEALAAELGVSIGSVHTIQEGYARSWSGYGSWWGGFRGGMTQNVIQSAGPSDGEGGPTVPGQIAIDARVTVSFELDD